MTSANELVVPPLDDILSTLRVVSIPMKVKFRGVTYRESALIKGPAGWGEFAPFLEYQPAEASAWLKGALEAAWQGFPEPKRHEIPLNATVPAVGAHEVERVLSRYEGSIREVKVKVAEKGQTLSDDCARVAKVRELLPDAGIKVDANMGWDPPQAVESLTHLSEYDLLYAEQPVATIEGLAQVRAELREKGNSLLIAADESVRKAEDPLKVAQAKAADVLIIKAAPLGGIRSALRIVEKSGLPCVISSALETSIGISAGAALAASLPELPFGCGLGTVSLLDGDVTENSLVARDGMLPVRTVEPSQELLTRFSASDARVRWWRERIEHNYAHLVINN